jgi:serine/threonine-protein kinase
MSEPTSSLPPDAPGRPRAHDPAGELLRRWEQGDAPDVATFLARAGPLPPAELAAVLRVDQRQRWRRGERVPAESYLPRLPGNPPDLDLALDLIYNEYLVREQLGERPDLDDYCRRFPDVAPVLREQIALHRAVESLSAPPPTQPWPGASVASPAEGALPRPFGPYRLVAVLGQGGMGTVYLADDPRLGRQVALKVPHFDPARAAEAAERFRREARAAAGVRHPNLVPVYEVGQVDGTDYLTMPYITGEPLSARLAREGPLPPTEAVRLALRIADAMEAVHRAGVVHRDLKPANILLDERGEPAVTDFGLARLVGGLDARLTGSGTVLGTPAYLAPEQVGCRPEAIGPRCDVYSLGVVLYEMLTGRVPFGGSRGEVLFHRVLSEDPEPPSGFCPGLDARLEAACLQALARRADRRFGSMAEFADALRRVAEGPAAQPVPVGRPARRVAAGLTAVALVGTVVGLAIWGVLRPRGDRGSQAAPQADPFRAGSRWVGYYVFTRPRHYGSGDAELTVRSRAGSSFAGTYRTQSANKEYRWEVVGRAEGGRIHWELGKPLNDHARKVRSPTRRAICTGTYDDREARVRYEDEDDHSQAEMTLKSRP